MACLAYPPLWTARPLALCSTVLGPGPVFGRGLSRDRRTLLMARPLDKDRNCALCGPAQPEHGRGA